MVLDVIVFAGLGITLRPHPPRWTMAFFWLLAWPVSLLKPVFPNHTPGAHAPSLAAWAGGAIIDLIWVSALVYIFWRPHESQNVRSQVQSS